MASKTSDCVAILVALPIIMSYCPRHPLDIIKETDRYHTEYKILEKIERFPLIDDLEMHYIELQKFQPE